MAYQNIKLDIQGNGLARLELARPESMNLVSSGLCKELVAASKELESNPSVRVVIFTAQGKAFSAGGDFNDFLANRDRLPEHIHVMAGEFHDAILRLQRLRAPIVSGINGTAAGGGMSLALGGDIIIAKRSAKLVSAYTRLGLTPDGGVTFFLTRLVGHAKAFELMSLNPTLSADEAHALGIINRVVEDGEFEAELARTAEALLALPGDAAGNLKKLLAKHDLALLERQLKAEQEAITEAVRDPGMIERLEGFLARKK